MRVHSKPALKGQGAFLITGGEMQMQLDHQRQFDEIVLANPTAVCRRRACDSDTQTPRQAWKGCGCCQRDQIGGGRQAQTSHDLQASRPACERPGLYPVLHSCETLPLRSLIPMLVESCLPKQELALWGMASCGSAVVSTLVRCCMLLKEAT